ncbi:electron transfer flavoprotein subunit beta/FixA family protein [Anaerobranca gottschalkii]|uniref:Electron transfer flavoprotein small subunit n=1 Tax=Anaerobranca gottschalkii DSM 13577 TaxID=1120990 RepID=A0A1H9YM87_9FIRM|nr:electron transfer flavoprotein subunit beta/FixA family protein [Anaerobranca gottschalkii]SES70237.1 electron transfer flavoprotein beta subunit [Anaerobranca gottschalkii DSM 13577]
MKIIVCIKQVPDTTEVRLDPKTGTLIREGVPSIINPDDKSGLEAALRLKEEVGAEVTVLTMGPPQAELALREALAMGADKGILLTDRAFAGADTWATSQTLAAAIRKLEYDLIIAGRQAIDGDTAQVGPQIAEHLGLPQVSYVEDLKLDGEYLLVKRIFEDGYQWIKIKKPCLITTLKEMNEPRYMSVGGIFDAYREKEIIKWTLEDIDVDRSNIGLKGSPTKVKKSFTKGVKGKGVIHKDLTPKEAAKVIADKLREKFII